MDRTPSQARTNRQAFFLTLALFLLLLASCVFWLFQPGRLATRVRSAFHIQKAWAVVEDADWVPLTEEDGSWNLLLVNRWNALPADLSPQLTVLQNGQSVDRRIYPALMAMFETMEEAGVYPVVVAGYRTQEKQQQLMDDKVAELIAQGFSPEEAQVEAQTWVALPGTSEHQLGLAVDIGADPKYSTSEEVYAWLEENSARFGFILRYPADKVHLTGIQYEPWHFRYVGVPLAETLTAQGLCLEEYLAGENSILFPSCIPLRNAV